MRNNFLCVVLTFCALSLCFKAQAMAQAQEVYVADFGIDSQAVSEDTSKKGPLEALRPGIIRDMDAQRLATDADRLAQQLSGALVDELNQRGISASRVSNVPAGQGVLVQGEFVGLGGSGETMQVRVMMDNLGDRSEEKFDLGATSGRKAPGEGSAVAMAARGNPYALAARFVLSKKAAKDEVVKLASEIADKIQKYLGIR